jgi:hypothetical protein
VGFYLWIDGDLAWAQGTYEYRPMGAAVISARDLFRRRDFNARRKAPRRAEYVGQFASIGHLNQELIERRGGQLNAEARRTRRKRGEEP